MEDHAKAAALWAALGAAVGVGLALGLGLRALGTGAALGIGAGVGLGVASDMKRRRTPVVLVRTVDRPALH